jgi:hypothetical protein
VAPLVLVVVGRDPRFWQAWALSLIGLVAGVGGRAWAQRRHPGYAGSLLATAGIPLAPPGQGQLGCPNPAIACILAVATSAADEEGRPMSSDTLDALIRKAYREEVAHAAAADTYAPRGVRLSALSAAFAAAAGTTVLSTPGEDRTLILIAGVVALLSALLGAVVAATKYPERAAAHRVARARFSALRMQLMLLLEDRSADVSAAVKTAIDELEEAIKAAPPYGKHFYKYADAYIRTRGTQSDSG